MGKRKEFNAEVVSDRMKKTVIVKVTQIKKHPRYAKVIRGYAKFKAHDEKNTCKIGDIVRIIETRPLSKDKRFLVAEILKPAATTSELKEEAK
jgi:small subunit ribosomal protein S17